MTSSDIRIQFYGLFRSYISLSNVARQYARALTDHFPGVALSSYVVRHAAWSQQPPLEYAAGALTQSRLLDDALSRFEGCDPTADIGVFCGIPDQAMRYLAGHRRRIGLFVCETDRIPQSWVAACNSLDRVFVPSRFCQAAYRDSGVTVDVDVMSHALEPEYVPQPGLRPGIFTFYNTFNALSSPERKSCEELIRCFLRAFPAATDVVLRLRTQESPVLQDCRRRYDFGDRVRIDPLVFCDTPAFARMYSEVHCTVHPSKGEGFGLIPLQSIACETPVITSGQTGMADYISHDNAIVLKTMGMTHGDSWGDQPGNYFAVDEDHLVQCLRHAREHWEVEQRRVRAAAAGIRERFSAGRVFRPLLDAVAGLLQ